MSRQIIQVFEEYQKARVKFVQTVAELARSPGAVPSLQAAGAMALLRPLLLDTVPSVQQAASVAIGRLASHSQELAEAVVAAEILPQLVYSLADQNRFYKKSAAIVLRAVARHSPGLAQAVSDCGAVEALVGCLEEFDTGVKETAAWALAHVARHSPALATKVVDASAVPLLVLAVQEPEVAVKHVAVACLADIAKHTPELAQTVVDGGAVPHIAALIASSDARLRRQVCCALAHVARHSAELAEVVVDATVLPRIFDLLRDVDAGVRKNAATCVRELCKHSAELSQLVVNAGGAAALVDFVASSSGAAQLPGTMALGYIAAFSETLALSLLVAQAVPPLAACLEPECEDFARAAAAWALGQLGRHTAEHARRVADGNVMPRLLAIVVAPEGAASADTRAKAKHALKAVVLRCTHLPALSPLLHAPAAPPGVLKHVLGQYARLLPLDVAAKREFLSSRGLAVLQSIKATPGSELADAIAAINRCYPPEIVQFFSPDYADTFADKIAAYQASGAV